MVRARNDDLIGPEFSFTSATGDGAAILPDVSQPFAGLRYRALAAGRALALRITTKASGYAFSWLGVNDAVWHKIEHASGGALHSFHGDHLCNALAPAPLFYSIVDFIESDFCRAFLPSRSPSAG